MNYNFELYYDNGGHGGPYANFNEAKTAAKRLLAGCRSMRAAELRPYNSPARGGYAERNPGSHYEKAAN